MAVLQFADVLQVKDTHSVRVPVPEWGDDAEVELVTMASATWDELQQLAANCSEDAGNAKGFRAKFVAASWGDGNGKRTPLSDTQTEQLGARNPAVIARLYDAVVKLHGAQGQEDAEKN